jgi:hypothetical protein
MHAPKIAVGGTIVRYALLSQADGLRLIFVCFTPIADMGAQQVLASRSEATRRRGSSRDAGDLRALKTQTIHQPLLIENKADDGVGKAVAIDGSSGANRDDHD